MMTSLSAAMSDRSAYPVLNNRTLSETIECPKCGKHAVVKRSPNIYDCINCSFHKELSPVVTTRPFPPAYLARQVLPSQARFPHSSIPHSNIYREETANGDKTHPLVFAALVVIIGILFL